MKHDEGMWLGRSVYSSADTVFFPGSALKEQGLHMDARRLSERGRLREFFFAVCEIRLP
jgi:hypothetical protein